MTLGAVSSISFLAVPIAFFCIPSPSVVSNLLSILTNRSDLINLCRPDLKSEEAGSWQRTPRSLKGGALYKTRRSTEQERSIQKQKGQREEEREAGGLYSEQDTARGKGTRVWGKRMWNKRI